jgi:hypothetical protein
MYDSHVQLSFQTMSLYGNAHLVPRNFLLMSWAAHRGNADPGL